MRLHPVGPAAPPRRAMRADLRTAHPYYWAGYQVAGSDGWTAGTTSANLGAVSVLH